MSGLGRGGLFTLRLMVEESHLDVNLAHDFKYPGVSAQRTTPHLGSYNSKPGF